MIQKKIRKKRHNFHSSKIYSLYPDSCPDIFKLIIGLILIPIIMLILTFNCKAASFKPEFDNNTEAPWHITADDLSYDKKTGQYIAMGNVIITKQEKRLTADFVRFDQQTMNVLADGHVIMTVKEDVLTGSRMEINLEAEVGTIYNGTLFISKNHFYISGDTIRKTGKDTYDIDKASATTCDGDNPAWKITGRNLKVTLEGYGFVQHAALWAKKVPVIYSPFFVFPAKIKRQSGLLPPQIGYSDRKGEMYLQPFFWAINESSDATFYVHHMERRGDKIGLEYRYIPDDQSKGILMYDFLNDMKTDDGTGESSDKWGYEDDDELRPNSDRYWFRMKHDQAMPFGFFAKLDIDIVSDQDYLTEFKRGHTGFEETDSYFNKNFGRDIDDYNDSTRVNRLNLNKIWTKYSLNAEARWYDNVINRRWKDTDTTLQKLPFVDFNALKQQIFNSPLYFDLDSGYTYFYRQDGTEDLTRRGHRMDVHPRVYLPYRFKNYFNIEPSLGVTETIWYVDKDDQSLSEKEETQSREIYDIKLDLSTDIFRVYDANGKHISKIKHLIRPQVIYDYISPMNQEKYPNFDSLDRIDKKNLITYSITNTFTSRSQKHAADKHSPKNENDQPIGYEYDQFCRLKLEQSYDINEEKEDNPSKWANQKSKEPFSPVHLEFELIPNRYFSLRGDAEWSPYDNRLQSHNVWVNLSDKRGDKLFIEHRYEYDSIKSIYLHLDLILSDRLSSYGEYERNIHEQKDILSSLGFLYRAQCWSINLMYSDEDDDSRYAFMINLYGLGEFGTN